MLACKVVQHRYVLWVQKSYYCAGWDAILHFERRCYGSVRGIHHSSRQLLLGEAKSVT